MNDKLCADWFTEWPAEALKGVATAMMTETDLELGGALEGIVEMFRCVLLKHPPSLSMNMHTNYY